MLRRTSRPEPLNAEALRAGAAGIGIDLDAAQGERLIRFGALLQRWNRVHNLTAVDSTAQLISHHLLDSLALVPELSRVIAAGETAGLAVPAKVLDVGSGAGLPGLVVAIARPHVQMTLIDAVQKKTAFLTQVVVELQLANVEVIHGRVEQLAATRAEPFAVIISRAFASLSDFVRLTSQLLADGGTWLAMKGRAPDSELAALPPEVRARAVIPLHVPGLQAQRHLIEIVRSTSQ